MKQASGTELPLFADFRRKKNLSIEVAHTKVSYFSFALRLAAINQRKKALGKKMIFHGKQKKSFTRFFTLPLVVHA